MPEKVLLTGATGLLGSQVLGQLLERGHQVRALRRTNSRMEMVQQYTENVEWVVADITDIVALEDAFEGITQVCHCAAVVSFHPRDLRRMMQINVEGTANLINLSLDFGINRFIHTSSIAALGRAKNRTHLDEKSAWENSPLNSQYAISKYLSEQEVWRGAAEGLSVGIINPSIIIGSGYWQENTARFFDQIYHGLKFCPGGATGLVDARDVAQFMVLLLESDVAEERFVLNGANITYRHFFDLIARELGVPAPTVNVAPWMAELAWRVEWLREKLTGSTPVVTRETARSSTQSFTYGNEKSLKYFPDFHYRSIEETIRDTAAQYLRIAS